MDKTSTELIQSSCRKDARCNGGIVARTYSAVKVDSAERPLAERYSSIEVRRNVPLMRNSKGIGLGDCRRVFTRVESA